MLELSNTSLGEHYIIDMWIKEEFPYKAGCIEAIDKAIKAAGATKLNEYYHEFPNGGFTGVVALAESHISVHTWPEKGFVAFDIFTCGDSDCNAAFKALVDYFHPYAVEFEVFNRGVRTKCL